MWIFFIYQALKSREFYRARYKADSAKLLFCEHNKCIPISIATASMSISLQIKLTPGKIFVANIFERKNLQVISDHDEKMLTVRRPVPQSTLALN